MMHGPYNAAVLDCFANTGHAGDLDGAAVAYFEDQGLRIRLAARTADDRIVDIRFLAYGCPHVIAACETICRVYTGAPVADLEQFDTEQIMDDLAVPVEKTGRILVLEDTVRSLRAAISDQRAHGKQDNNGNITD